MAALLERHRLRLERTLTDRAGRFALLLLRRADALDEGFAAA